MAISWFNHVMSIFVIHPTLKPLSQEWTTKCCQLSVNYTICRKHKNDFSVPLRTFFLLWNRRVARTDGAADVYVWEADKCLQLTLIIENKDWKTRYMAMKRGQMDVFNSREKMQYLCFKSDCRDGNAACLWPILVHTFQIIRDSSALHPKNDFLTSVNLTHQPPH